ncbi:MAG TPA: class IV adenylate cyclase [Holophagaceae bacterium]|nr:class IV adenylate cyclase [Holophagaceae bacterium]
MDHDDGGAALKHRNPIETELKLRIPAVAPMQTLLASMGFKEETPAQPELSVLWDRGEELRAKGEALRVRRYAGRVILTWKGAKLPDPVLKIRPEQETVVDDGEELEAILRALGFAPVLRMEKSRAVWAREELTACLDETPFGCFLELEGDANAIKAAAEHLSLGADRVEPRSYPTLFRAHGLG